MPSTFDNRYPPAERFARSRNRCEPTGGSEKAPMTILPAGLPSIARSIETCPASNVDADGMCLSARCKLAVVDQGAW